MLFYYVQDVYKKNKLGTKHQWSWGLRGEGQCSETLRGGFGMQSPLGKLSGSNNHLDCLKIDLNVASIQNTAQDYKHKKN